MHDCLDRGDFSRRFKGCVRSELSLVEVSSVQLLLVRRAVARGHSRASVVYFVWWGSKNELTDLGLVGCYRRVIIKVAAELLCLMCAAPFLT